MFGARTAPWGGCPRLRSGDQGAGKTLDGPEKKRAWTGSAFVSPGSSRHNAPNFGSLSRDICCRQANGTPENRAFIHMVAADSPALLKNSKSVLPPKYDSNKTYAMIEERFKNAGTI
ncbi:hypothetical protein ACJZ2D_013988 [Fusarium nematophilum]